MPMRWASALSLLELGDQVARSAAPKFPLLIIHDPEDEITSGLGSREFYDRCTSRHKKYVAIKGGLHDLFANEGPLVAKHIIEWADGLGSAL